MGSVLFLKKHVRAQLLRETTIGLANNAEIDHRSLCTRGVTCKCAVVNPTTSLMHFSKEFAL